MILKAPTSGCRTCKLKPSWRTKFSTRTRDRAVAGEGHNPGYPAKEHSQDRAPFRQGALQGPPPHRKLHLQAEAIPRYRHPLRQDVRNFLAGIHLTAATILLN